MKVGDKVYIVYRDFRKGRNEEMIVEKVGREYFYLKWGLKVNIKTMLHHNPEYGPDFRA